MYALVVHLLQPYPLLLLLLWLALAGLWRRRRETRRCLLFVAVPLLLLTLMSLPAVAHVAAGTLVWRYAPALPAASDAGAIVVLGGAVLPPDPGRPHGELATDSLLRCLRARELHCCNPAIPVLVTGGKVDPDVPGPTVAEAMADFLESVGVGRASLLVESGSRTTYENAVEARKLLEARQVRKIILVTEARHMLRAELCFRKQGFEVVPSPCAHSAAEFRPGVAEFLPHPNAVRTCQQVVYEWLGLAWYWLHGRV
ncbi:MAG TPA: YdcF family protein [Gemmataceae bacterium]|nr:YdcF family protein [Gemmataceae bacterium]